VESLEYNLTVLWLYASSLEGLYNSLLLEGGEPGTLEEREEISLLNWEEALARVEVVGELSRVR
jgi:hypothetical protein